MFRVGVISLTSMMSYNNVMKILFLNNFSLMNSIKEELILQIMWITSFFLVTSMIINEQDEEWSDSDNSEFLEREPRVS